MEHRLRAIVVRITPMLRDVHIRVGANSVRAVKGNMMGCGRLAAANLFTAARGGGCRVHRHASLPIQQPALYHVLTLYGLSRRARVRT